MWLPLLKAKASVTLLAFGLLLLADPAMCKSDMIPNVDWHVRNASTIFRMRVQTENEEKKSPSPSASRRMVVTDVLKGVFPEHEIILPRGSTQIHDALVLIPYEHPVSYQPFLQTKRSISPVYKIWIIDAQGKVNTNGVPIDGNFFSRSSNQAQDVSEASIKASIKADTPEEMGLNDQIKDPKLVHDETRKTYICFVRAMRGLDDSTNKTYKSAIDRWPAVPINRQIPPDRFPQALIDAVDQLNCKNFSAQFRIWSSSGVLRDRLVQLSTTLPFEVVEEARAGGALGQSGPILPPSPYLSSKLLFDKNMKPTDKMKLIALLAELWNYDRWAAERAAAIKTVQDAPADSDIVRRAAFWEPCDTNLVTAGGVAIEKLVTCTGENQQEDLVAIFLTKPLNSAAYYAIQKAIAANHKHVTDRLEKYAATHKDKAAQSIGRIYASIKNAALTNTLITWLFDSNPTIRKEAAIDFCILPNAEAVTPLLKACNSETNKDAKESMIEALAQTNDPRSFDVLCKAPIKDASKNTQIQIARGFARLKDKRALRYLANLSSTAEDDQIRWEAIKAFGYISGLFAAGPPDQFNSSSGMDMKTFAEGKKIVAQWK